MASVDDLALRVGRPAPPRPREDSVGLVLAGWGLVAVCAFIAAISAWQFTDSRKNPIDEIVNLVRGDPMLLAGRDAAPQTTGSVGDEVTSEAEARAPRVVLAGPAAQTAVDVEGLRREVIALKNAVDMLSRTNADLARRVALLEDSPVVTGSIAPPPGATTPKAPAPPAAVLPPAPTTKSADLPDPVVTRSDFALDLGAKANLSTVRSSWTTLVRAHAEIIGPLTPLVQMREGADGKLATHLIAGPFANAVLAAAACERLKAAGTACETALFSGQGLALR